jgi:hypothetical protein
VDRTSVDCSSWGGTSGVSTSAIFARGGCEVFGGRNDGN